MSRRSVPTRLVAAALALAGGAMAQPVFGGAPWQIVQDPAGDAALRATSTQGKLLLPNCSLPDLLSVKAGTWTSPTPTTDPYSGSYSSSGHLLRIDVVIDGFVNPPGPLTGPVAFDPFAFGPLPLYGFIEFDVDRNRDTGGETSAAAVNRWLANAARFGGLPSSSMAGRAPRWRSEIDLDYTTDPDFERTGSDWTLSLCGCFTPTIVSETTPNGQFDPGETMIVRGRFFQRAGGYKAGSAVIGGSSPGAYDPLVNLRFSHSLTTDQTTVTLVYALDMVGASQLTGQTVQSVDTSVSNHTSIQEGVQDLINRSTWPGLTGLAWTLMNEWHDQNVNDALEVDHWRIAAIIGTTYTAPCDTPYVWTDIGFEITAGDMDGDESVSAADAALLSSIIAQYDGTYDDADLTVNGEVVLKDFGNNFSLYDIDYDGVIGPGDLAIIAPNPADFDHSGTVTVADLFAFLDAWFATFGTTGSGLAADIDHSGAVTVADLFSFLDSWFASI